MRYKLHIAILVLLALLPEALLAGIPAKPTDHKIIHDYAGIINDNDEAVMEDSLERFSRETSNQIVVVTVPTLDGMDKAEYAAELGQSWGVGGKKYDNGIVILIKPKTSSEKGEAFISTGYGLEGALPDALCTKIVMNEMIPRFKNDDYTGGLWNALRVIMPICRGEYSEEEYLEDEEGDELLGAIVAALILGFIMYRSFKNTTGGSSGSRTYTGGPIIFGSGSGGSSWSSGGGSSWGGFGGGSFGGGGGGGSW